MGVVEATDAPSSSTNCELLFAQGASEASASQTTGARSPWWPRTPWKIRRLEEDAR